MKKLSIFLVLSLLFSITSIADEFEVKKFEKAPNDISARANAREDVNGNACAIIKVLTDLGGLGFESNLGIVGNVVKKPGEYWLYVSPGERRIRVAREGFIPLAYNLPERDVESTVYRMILTRKAGSGTVSAYTTGIILLKSNPAGVNVYIENEFKGKTPLSKEMESGYFNFRLVRQNFYDSEGEFRVFIDSTIEVNLDPNFGSLNVTNIPADVPAGISIDGINLNLQTPITIDTLQTGPHTITLQTGLYEPVSREFVINDNEVTELEIPLNPIFGNLTIVAGNTDEIFIDGVKRGNTPKIINDLLIGNYEISLAKNGYVTVKTTVAVNEDERTTISENLDNFREVRITSAPSGANMILNGKSEGSTPKNLTVQYGQNSIKLTKAGYNDFKQNFTITEQKREYHFIMTSDAKALAEVDFYKYKKRKNWWLGGTIVSAAAGGYFYFAVEKHYKDYKTATDDATHLHNKDKTEDTIWPIAFGISGVCAVMTIINGSKQGKAKKRMNISAIPVEGGGMVVMKVKF